jgi:hypothetical protein
MRQQAQVDGQGREAKDHDHRACHQQDHLAAFTGPRSGNQSG